MANKGYTTREEIENYLLITIDPTFYSQIETWIGEIESYIDKTTERNFKADSEENEKVYDGDGTSSLLVDDFISSEDFELKINDTVVDSDSYFLYPANYTPKTKIQLNGDRFRKGFQNISVSALWGYSEEVPADIRTVATVLVAGIINFSLNAEGEVQSMTIGRYSVTYKDKTQWADFERTEKIMQNYVKETL